jgi:hypothetical protein
VRRRSVFVVLVVAAALLASGCRSSPPPIGPGGKIGPMTLVREIEPKADDELWRFCAPAIPKPGTYHRTCFVPHIERLFIGYGDWERTRNALDSVWKQLKWTSGSTVAASTYRASAPPSGSSTAFHRLEARTRSFASGA